MLPVAPGEVARAVRWKAGTSGFGSIRPDQALELLMESGRCLVAVSTTATRRAGPDTAIPIGPNFGLRSSGPPSTPGVSHREERALGRLRLSRHPTDTALIRRGLHSVRKLPSITRTSPHS